MQTPPHRLILAAALLVLVPVSAQVVPAPGPASAAANQAIELSPFLVTAEEDQGYQAFSTLGGTRLRTDLRDLPASISVITKEFMEDLGLDTLENLAPYTLGTEVGGLNGNFSDAEGSGLNFDDTLRAVTPNIRVRGLAPATRTRDYFLSDISDDSYNIERTEIQRGPNGMLYGLGSPSGVVNGSLIRANVQRTRTKVTTRLGSFGSYRASLDHNQVLLKDKLALRIAPLFSHTEYQIKHAYTRDRRGFGALTYKPFASTTLRFASEIALVKATPPQNRPPIDGFTFWWEAGRPVYDGVTGAASFLGTPTTGRGFNGTPMQFLGAGLHAAGSSSIVIEDVATGVYGLSIAGRPDAAVLVPTRVRRNPANTAWVNGQIFATALGVNYLQATNGGSTDPASIFWQNQTLTDPAIFDFFNNQLSGPASSRNRRWKTFNVALEQRLGRHAGIELAFDRQDLDQMLNEFSQGGTNYRLSLDVTTRFADGTPNPNFGRPFSAMRNWSISTRRQREAFRSTAYYDFDFNRVFREGSLLSKILGRHTLTGNFTSQDNAELTFIGGPMVDMEYYNIFQVRNAGTTTVANPRSDGPRSVNVITYYGPNLVAASGPQNQGIRGLQQPVGLAQTGISSLSLYYYPTPPNSATVAPPWQLRPFGVHQPDKWSAEPVAQRGSKTYSDFRSLAAVMQSRWFENTLVSTVGWRRDWVETFDALGAPFNDAGRILPHDSVWPLQPVLNQRHDAVNYGLVLHVPKFIARHLPKSAQVSFLYNRSDNFTPQEARYNVYGAEIDPTMGETREYGVMVSLFNRKIELRASHYESSSSLATLDESPILEFDRFAHRTLTGIQDHFWDGIVPDPVMKAYMDFVRSPVASVFYSPNVTGYYLDDAGRLHGATDGTQGRVHATTDTVAKGWELELTANPTRNWRLSMNAARQETVRSNTATDFWELLQSWRPFLVDGLAGNMIVQPSSNETWRQHFLAGEATLRRIRALDGTIAPEVRKWRFNVISRYAFDQGRLKGWAIGGAMRWQDKSAIGYPVTIIDGLGQFDVTRPYFGSRETNVDGWIGYSRRLQRVNWRAQLNVRDIGKKDELIPIHVQPDGTPHAYRIGASMTWTLSNTFEF